MITKLTKDLDIIFLTKFGSHLYGTNTEKSDTDIKGVFIPSKDECYLNRIPKSINYNSGESNSKNTSEDVDIEIYSIQYYLKLLQTGDTGALDILHAMSSKSCVEMVDDRWMFLYENRSDFYTTNLRAFVGYCRTQAAKYGIKGSRLNEAKMFLEFLSSCDESKRLNELGELPTGEHINRIEADPENGVQFPMIQVCGRKIQETVTVKYAYSVIDKFYQSYGERAKLAASNEGIDWKALSHAVRCAIEMRSIYKHGDIIFPLEEASELVEIKNGEKDYLGYVSPRIESLMEEVEELAEKSNLPKKPNMKKFDNWVLELYK